MRISDWSSDVCSSDLHHRHRIELVAERLGKTRIAFIAADADDHAAPGLDVEVATVAFGAHADDALAIVNQFLGADAGMQRDTTIERALDEVRRSEEHTSELQSLMRISYAVLCLQKKTKKASK